MRGAMLAAAIWLGGAAVASAIPYFPPPQQVEDAPLERALANIAKDGAYNDAERARMQGRLNLLAYMRDTETFSYLKDGGQLVEAGSILCNDAPPPMPRHSDQPLPVFGPTDRCAKLDFALGPEDEIPDGGKAPAKPSAAARERLVKAEANYKRALELDATNLRAHLGRAYALDRLGKKSEARKELRKIVQIGLPKLSEPQSDWEEHAVLTEAMTHLSVLAVSRADKKRVAQVKARLDASRPMIYVTPMVVPLSDAPFSALHDSSSNVAFDFAGTGDTRAQGWLTQDAAWLVWDPRGRGEIKSGFDLIGSVTWAAFWRDGFQVLRALDDDRSGFVDGDELKGLALWRDMDRDGVSDAGEVKPVMAHGVTALATSGAGVPDLLIAPAGVTFKNGAVRPLYDWTPRGRAQPNS